MLTSMGRDGVASALMWRLFGTGSQLGISSFLYILYDSQTCAFFILFFYFQGHSQKRVQMKIHIHRPLTVPYLYDCCYK